MCVTWCKIPRCPASWSCNVWHLVPWHCHNPGRKDSRHLKNTKNRGMKSWNAHEWLWPMFQIQNWQISVILHFCRILFSPEIDKVSSIKNLADAFIHFLILLNSCFCNCTFKTSFWCRLLECEFVCRVSLRGKLHHFVAKDQGISRFPLQKPLTLWKNFTYFNFNFKFNCCLQFLSTINLSFQLKLYIKPTSNLV